MEEKTKHYPQRALKLILYMNSENEKKETKSSNPALFSVESFNKAVASRDEIIANQKATIETLQAQIGNQQTSISELMTQNENEKASRAAAETELAEKKELKVEHKGNY